MKNRLLRGLFAGSVGLITLPTIALACSVCLTGTNDPTADAFNSSVIFLMATPYLVVGSITGWLVYTHRHAALKRKQMEAAEPLVQLSLHQEETGR